MSLLIDTNDMPIGYELFSGNTFDGKTMDYVNAFTDEEKKKRADNFHFFENKNALTHKKAVQRTAICY